MFFYFDDNVCEIVVKLSLLLEQRHLRSICNRQDITGMLGVTFASDLFIHVNWNLVCIEYEGFNREITRTSLCLHAIASRKRGIKNQTSDSS